MTTTDQTNRKLHRIETRVLDDGTLSMDIDGHEVAGFVAGDGLHVHWEGPGHIPKVTVTFVPDEYVSIDPEGVEQVRMSRDAFRRARRDQSEVIR